MQETESEKTNLTRKGEAFALKNAQLEQAASLHESETETARVFKNYNRKKAKDLLNNDKEIKETAEEARRYAADTLAGAQGEAAAILEDSQAKAAAALKDSQSEAASALEAALTFRDQ